MSRMICGQFCPQMAENGEQRVPRGVGDTQRRADSGQFTGIREANRWREGQQVYKERAGKGQQRKNEDSTVKQLRLLVLGIRRIVSRGLYH